MARCSSGGYCCNSLLVGFVCVVVAWLVYVFMTLVFSSYVPATCLVTSTRVDVRVCSCKNPYVGVVEFLVQSTKYSASAFTLDVSCEPTYNGALAEVTAAYAINKTYDCLYNDYKMMWPNHRTTVLFTWFTASIVVTSLYFIFLIVVCVQNKGKC